MAYKITNFYAQSEFDINDKLQVLKINPNRIINIETKKDKLIVWYKQED